MLDESVTGAVSRDSFVREAFTSGVNGKFQAMSAEERGQFSPDGMQSAGAECRC
jgi:hypothetical protein